MTRDQIWQAVSAYLRVEFGKLVVPRTMRRIRRVAGDAYVVNVVAVTSSGDIPIAEVEVDEEGVMSPALAADDLVEALRRPPASAMIIEGPSQEAIDAFGDLIDEPAPTSKREDLETVGTRVEAYLSLGDDASLRHARDLMPRLLADPEMRGATLMRLASVEARLGPLEGSSGWKKIALGYVEAAAREFADRFDVDMLERAAGLALELLGRQAFVGSPVHTLLEQSRVRLRPLHNIWEAQALGAVTDKQRAWLEKNITLRTLSPGEFLVREGEPSRAVFIIKSGLLSVLLNKEGLGGDDGGFRMVRCCFPGWLLGESSVLVKGDPRCTASLRAERVSEVWGIEAAILDHVMEENQALYHRIAATKQIHRIDSFFSMHETMSQLDVQVRDEMLGCIARIQAFDEDALLVAAGQVPPWACLVARGEITVHEADKLDAEPIAVIGADGFLGVRDALHEIPSGNSAVVRAGSTIAFFDGEKLRALGARSPEHVVAVLERLG